MELKTILRHISKDKKDYYLIDLYVYYDSGKRYRSRHKGQLNNNPFCL